MEKVWAVCVAVCVLAVVAFLSLLAVTNAAMSNKQNEIDGRNYATCVQHWSPAECRVGQYGAR